MEKWTYKERFRNNKENTKKAEENVKVYKVL